MIETTEKTKTGNILKAINIAIQEFVDKTTDKNSENRRIIVILTSKFEIQNEGLDEMIRKLHALNINIIIFGYELDSLSNIQEEDDLLEFKLSGENV